MPALYAAADAQARSAQRKFVRLQLAEIALPLIGVALGVLLPIVEPWKWLGLAASAVVAAAALLRVVERTSQVENVWYSARSCAETIKSRAWCFAVAAAPFPPELDENAATVAFIESLRAISSDFAGLEPPEPGEEISAAMRLLRESPFAIRSQSYVDGRLVDQHQWYAAKSRVASTAAQRWDAAFYVLVAVAVVAGVFLVSSSGAAAVVAIGGAGAGSVLTWSSVRRLSSTARSYSRVATDLSLLKPLAPTDDTPAEWSHFVTSVEDRIARENQQWRAARL